MSDEETAPEMLARLGTDAMLWAQEFNKTAIKLGYSEMDEGWLIGWFANAIENCDVIRCNPLRAELAAVTAERDRMREENENIKAANRYGKDWVDQASQDITRLRADLAAVTAERDRMREALLFAELMASEMGVDPREKCQRIYDDLHAARAALEGLTNKSGDGNE